MHGPKTEQPARIFIFIIIKPLVLGLIEIRKKDVDVLKAAYKYNLEQHKLFDSLKNVCGKNLG